MELLEEKEIVLKAKKYIDSGSTDMDMEDLVEEIKENLGLVEKAFNKCSLDNSEEECNKLSANETPANVWLRILFFDFLDAKHKCLARDLLDVCEIKMNTDNWLQEFLVYFESEGDDTLDDIKNKRSRLNSAIQGWTAALNEEGIEKKPIFENWREGSFFYDSQDPNLEFKEMNSNVAPQNLTLTDENPANRIQFSGGSGIFEMVLNEDTVNAALTKIDCEGCNTKTEKVSGDLMDFEFFIQGFGAELETFKGENSMISCTLPKYGFFHSNKVNRFRQES